MANINLGDAEFQKQRTFSKVFSIGDSHIDSWSVYGGTIVKFMYRDKPVFTYEFLLKKLKVNPPYLMASYYENDSLLTHSFAIKYRDYDIVNRLEESVRRSVVTKELAKVMCKPAREIVITVDGKDTIRLNQNVESGNKFATFPIGQEDFLKCCNANHLKFEVFKGDDDEPITEFFSNEKDETLMIEQCRALYNYVVDDTMFPEALPKLLRRKKSESRRDVIRDVAIIGKVTIIFVLIVLFFLWAINH